MRPRPDTVIRLRAGGVVACGMVGEPTPGPGGGTWRPYPWGPGAAPLLARVADTRDRCAPWVDVHLGPELRGPDGVEWRGQAWAAGGVVLLAGGGWPPPDVLLALHHELWHAVEPWLSDAALGVVDAAWADADAPWGHPYLDDPRERRARLYEAWATAWDRGAAHSLAPGVLTAADVCWQVYAGEVAAEVGADAARQTVRVREARS